ncbi:MAG: hypothetical protein CMJ59_03540 [Planctomycetaceae bacterium]|nr:hypothetical protein [Planctomycetaceae bacterium]
MRFPGGRSWCLFMQWHTVSRWIRLFRRRRDISVVIFGLTLLVSVLGNATCYYVFEQAQNPTVGDALWFSVISLSTIGYGDLQAHSVGGRVGTVVFVIVLGLGSFSLMLGMLFEWLSERLAREQKGMGSIVAEDHILIVNFPSLPRIEQIVEELCADRDHGRREIVIVTDKIDELPLRKKNVLFVKGPVLDDETYRRAGIDRARLAIVLATDYDDTNSDAVVASAVAVIESMNESIYTVAECLAPRHRMLFDSVRCNAVVYSHTISGNLLTQEILDPGVALMMDALTSNTHESCLFATEVMDPPAECSYRKLAVQMVEQDMSLVCVQREHHTISSFLDINPTRGDRMIYVGKQRMTWDRLLAGVGYE